MDKDTMYKITTVVYLHPLLRSPSPPSNAKPARVGLRRHCKSSIMEEYGYHFSCYQWQTCQQEVKGSKQSIVASHPRHAKQE